MQYLILSLLFILIIAVFFLIKTVKKHSHLIGVIGYETDELRKDLDNQDQALVKVEKKIND